MLRSLPDTFKSNPQLAGQTVRTWEYNKRWLPEVKESVRNLPPLFHLPLFLPWRDGWGTSRKTSRNKVSLTGERRNISRGLGGWRWRSFTCPYLCPLEHKGRTEPGLYVRSSVTVQKQAWSVRVPPPRCRELPSSARLRAHVWEWDPLLSQAPSYAIERLHHPRVREWACEKHSAAQSSVETCARMHAHTRSLSLLPPLSKAVRCFPCSSGSVPVHSEKSPTRSFLFSHFSRQKAPQRVFVYVEEFPERERRWGGNNSVTCTVGHKGCTRREGEQGQDGREMQCGDSTNPGALIITDVEAAEAREAL